MLRVKKKLTFLLCGFCVAIFLFFYILINFSVPTDKQRNLLKQLENGFHENHKEMNNFKKHIRTIDIPERTNANSIQDENQRSQQTEPFLNNKEMFKDMIINANDYSKCSINTDTAPQPDVQMLDVYNELPFDNPDGGAWKQGWRIEYDPLQFNKHYKLKVFVVPHSHNDPGWLKTFNEYYEYNTKQILSNAVRHLTDNPDMKFIWAEICYFAKFYEPLGEVSKSNIKKLIHNKQLEFVTGGWVMPDEANSHWTSILMQLTEGQMWLKKHLNVTPTSSWAIDPFGHSPTLPYILKKSDFENLLIQRTHYSVKKHLAKNKQLEFRWRQIWDGNGNTELFTHMMPFYSYDVPHTCGPDPKICCQFDFKRLPGFGTSCPWQVAPQPIDELNVANKAEIIVDQWRKKATLYKTRSVLIPLGDDFRYGQSTEWEAQRKNFESLFDYINNEPSLFTEAKFGTLQEYFDSVRQEKDLSHFPSLSGDFFTYADRDDHYWSGYYTSRPFHKRMDRVLLDYIRSAEILRSFFPFKLDTKIDNSLQNARRQLSLFQHHDGITGTAKNDVVKDYAKRMLTAIDDCIFVMQHVAYRLLTNLNPLPSQLDIMYLLMDDARWPAMDEHRMVIIVGNEIPIKHVVIYNSLPKWRNELVEVLVNTPYVRVTDFKSKKVISQISPHWSWHKGVGIELTKTPQASSTKFRLIFKVKIAPLSLATYIVHKTMPDEENTGTTYARNTVLSETPFTVNLSNYPHQIEFAQPHDISIKMNKDGIMAAFKKNGFLKSVALYENSAHISTHLEFLQYGVRFNSKGTSGAYLFLPDGPASSLNLQGTTVIITQGELESSVSTGLSFATHTTVLRGDNSIEIQNVIDIGELDNREIAMRIKTGIKSEDVFYTDLNGLQIIKRKRFRKLPLQANYYPVPSTIFIEDDNTRLTLLSAQPLGGSSLKSGEIEIMQDRRLTRDDDRGLGQGVLDNKPVFHLFRLLLENREPCTKLKAQYPAGFLTVNAHNELNSMLHPLNKLILNENEWNNALGVFGEEHEPFEDGIELNVMRNLEYLPGRDKSENTLNTGIIIHRTNLEECSIDGNREGNVNIKRSLNLKDVTIHSTPLTFLHKNNEIIDFDINLCPMDLKAYIIER